MKVHPQIYRFILLFALSLLCRPAFGQATYPVQVYTQLIPPYTPNVMEYYSGGREKLRVMLVNTDMQEPLLNVYLRMKITSSSFSLINPPEVYTPAIQLQAGVPVQLSLDDLAVYFRQENIRISGNQSEFGRTRLLPDEFYRFHFEAFEVTTHKAVSNPAIGFAQAMIAAGDPPILNLPERGAVIRESNIPSIFFSWTPRHMNSVAMAYGTEYELTLSELYDKQTAPESAFLYSNVLYRETVRATSFIHTVAQPMLIPGMRYAWRVRAVARDGVDEVSIFRNNGYSEVFYFDYMADCRTVQILGAVYDKGRVRITWEEVGAMDYTVEYRKKGSTNWYTVRNIDFQSCFIYNLKYGTEYEYRVGTRCVANDVFDYSNIKAFRVPDKEERTPDCGLMPDVNLSNQVPAEDLIKGMPVFAGDFPVFITNRSGSNGRFSGEGYVGIPYLNNAQVAVTFNNILVNSDFQLVSGYFETKYDAENAELLLDIDETLNGGADVGDIRTGEEKAAFEVTYALNPHIQAKPSVTDESEDGIKGADGKYLFTKGENGKYVVVLQDEEGNERIIETDRIPFTIKDKTGMTYEVGEDGNVTEIASESSIILDPQTREKADIKLALVQFEPTGNTKYAVDQYRDVYAKVTDYFVKYKPSNSDMIGSAKFIVPGESDEVFVKIVETGEGFDPSKVRFVTSAGTEYKGQYDAVKMGWTLTLIGSADNDGQALYVVHEQEGKYVTLARLNIFSYTKKNIRVKLVPVNGFDNGFRADDVSRRLNAIYNPVGITCEVELTPSFSYDLGDGLNVTGSGLFSTETKDMKALNAAYLSAHPDEEGLCLFIVPKVTGADGIVGDMPRGKQFGYLFSGSTAQTIAHEIGHGLFHLDHPFARANASKSFDRGDLGDNLMEYEGGTTLVKFQWDAIHSPGLVIGLFERDKDAVAVGGKKEDLEAVLRKLEFNAFVLFYKCGLKTVISQVEYSDTITWSGVHYRTVSGTYSELDGLDLKPVYTLTESEYAQSDLPDIPIGHDAFILIRKENGIVLYTIPESEKYKTLCSNEFKATDEFYTYLREDIIQCSATIDSNEILRNLRIIKENCRNGQNIEFAHYDRVNGGYTYYTLNANDGLEKIQTPLTDEQIERGEWSSGADTRMRYTINSDGIIQLKAFGFRKDISIPSGKTANISLLSSHIKSQTNKLLIENQVTRFDQEAPVFKDDSEVLADGGQIVIGTSNTSFIKIISEGIGISTTLLKTGEVEEKVYLTKGAEQQIIHAPGLVTGSFEVIAQKVTDMTSLVNLLYDLVVDDNLKSQLREHFSELKSEIGKDPSTFLPIFGDVLSTVLSGNTSQEWDIIWDENGDTGRRSHLATRGVGNTIISAFNVHAAVLCLPKISESFSEWARKTVKSRNDLRKILDTDEGVEYLRKFFNEKVKTSSFKDWLQKAKEYKLGKALNFEVHHIIPIKVFKNNPELQRILNKFGFDFNSIDNGIPLQKKSKLFDVNGHGNHPDYDDFIYVEIENIIIRGDLTDLEKFGLIQEQINNMKKKLEIDVLLGSKNVNDIISW